MVKTGFLLVGHGSTKPYNKQLITSTAERIAKIEKDWIVKAAFMENSTPEIPEVLEEFKNEDIDKLLVVPMFLARGVHLDVDIPEILGIEECGHKGVFKTKNGEVPLIFAGPIGENPVLADLLIAEAKDAENKYL